MSGRIKTLYSDSSKTNAIFPTTKVSAVSDENGDTLDTILGELESAVSGLATVARTGSYSDLSNKPTLGDISSINKDNSTSHFLRGDGQWKTPSVSVPKFINASNIIANANSTSFDWTATQDCWVAAHSSYHRIYVDEVGLTDADSNVQDVTLMLKSGQRIRCQNYNGWGGYTIKAYGLKS